MDIAWLLLLVAAAGLGGYGLLVRLGVDDFDAWAGGRTAGVVAVALVGWWAGVLGAGWWRALGTVVLVALAGFGGRQLWRRRSAWRQLLAAEAVFTVGMLLVLAIRLDHPQIAGQEKPMDMGIFAVLHRTTEFPPPDYWLAGASFPYYYWGALLWTVPIATSGLPLEYAYNLVVALICGCTTALLWCLGRRLGAGPRAGAVAAFFGLFAGTPDGLRQLLSGVGLRSMDIWRSSRQHEDVITEFPLFTAWLGDLHPHLLSIPSALLAVLLAWWAVRGGLRWRMLAPVAVLFGVTWAANPWAMPPTLAAISLMLVCGDGRWHWPRRRPGAARWLAIVMVAAGGWFATAPFHLGFEPFFNGIKPVFAQTAPSTLLLYGGSLLVPVLLVAAGRLFGDGGAERRRTLAATAVALILVGAAVSGRPTAVLLGGVLVVLASWVMSPGERIERPALALAALGVFLLLVPEVLYVADGYGERLHRMNTVFKSYIQAWVLLAIALPVMLALASRRPLVRRVLLVAITVPTLPHLAWMVSNQWAGRSLGLDGLAWMNRGDRALVDHLRAQPVGTSLIEAVGGPYSEYSRFSANSGVPAYIGWENHELVWRGHDVTPETSRRRQQVEELYRCADPARVRELVRQAGVDLVTVGTLERASYPAEGLAAVVRAGTVELEADGAVLVRFARAADRAGEAQP